MHDKSLVYRWVWESRPRDRSPHKWRALQASRTSAFESLPHLVYSERNDTLYIGFEEPNYPWAEDI